MYSFSKNSPIGIPFNLNFSISSVYFLDLNLRISNVLSNLLLVQLFLSPYNCIFIGLRVNTYTSIYIKGELHMNFDPNDHEYYDDWITKDEELSDISLEDYNDMPCIDDYSVTNDIIDDDDNWY